MKLQTLVPIPDLSIKIDYESQCLFLGSCFSQHIGKQLEYHKIPTLINPFGIVFHPKALELLIKRVVKQSYFSTKDCFKHLEQWHSFEVHSSLSQDSQEALIAHLNNQLDVLHDKLRSATHVFITFGTAWGYRHVEKDQIVANCHKLPQKNFAKELYSVGEVAKTTLKIVTSIKNINPSAEVNFTVSPVRHLKDGFIENNQSKAHLIAGIHQAREKEPDVSYFPAYEIMMDELRDYRFYAKDMLHPNATAVDYIFERFKEACIAPSAYSIMNKVADIQRGLAHRPFNKKGKAHQQFLVQLKKKITSLQEEVPQISF